MDPLFITAYEFYQNLYQQISLIPADSKAVQGAIKGKVQGKGIFFPLVGCQKFDGEEGSFENGVFLGPVGHLTFKGPYTTKGQQLSFDVHTMYLGLGPWRIGIPLKKDAKPLSEVNQA